MPLVLDASGTLAWVLPGQETPLSTAILHAVMGGYPIVPGIWHFEVAAGDLASAAEACGIPIVKLG